MKMRMKMRKRSLSVVRAWTICYQMSLRRVLRSQRLRRLPYRRMLASPRPPKPVRPLYPQRQKRRRLRHRKPRRRLHVQVKISLLLRYLLQKQRLPLRRPALPRTRTSRLPRRFGQRSCNATGGRSLASRRWTRTSPSVQTTRVRPSARRTRTIGTSSRQGVC